MQMPGVSTSASNSSSSRLTTWQLIWRALFVTTWAVSWSAVVASGFGIPNVMHAILVVGLGVLTAVMVNAGSPAISIFRTRSLAQRRADLVSTQPKAWLRRLATGFLLVALWFCAYRYWHFDLAASVSWLTLALILTVVSYFIDYERLEHRR